MQGIRWAATFALALAGCLSATAEPFRAAAIVPSSAHDAAFSQSLSDALLLVQSERGAWNFEATVLENVAPADAETQLRQLAEDDFDLVIAHGLQYEQAVIAAAKAFPGTAFALGTTQDTHGLDNLAAYDARAEQGGYVNGAMAARLTRSGIVGVVGPVEVGDAARYVAGFVAGVRDTVPNVEARVTWTGSFDDTAAAAQAASALIAGGADVLTGVGQMTAGAIPVVRDAGLLWFGTQANQAPLAPETVVASQVYRWEDVLRPMVDAVATTRPRNLTYTIDFPGGGEVMSFNPAVPVPADVQQLANDTIARLVNGTLQVSPGPR